MKGFAAMLEEMRRKSYPRLGTVRRSGYLTTMKPPRYIYSKIHMSIKVFTFFAFIASVSFCRSEVTLNPIFGDHMVLQREKPVPVWGKADPGEKVAVSFGGQTQVATANSEGRWAVTLKPMPVSSASRILNVKGKNEISISDVLVGDVWLGSGQSNMDFPVGNTDRREEIKQMREGAFEGIRLFIVDQSTTDEPQESIAGGKWKEPVTGHIMEFSATLFYFGEELQKRMPGVPLGLIRSSVGATNLYSWIPNEVRDQHDSAEYLRSWWGKEIKNWTPEKQATRDQELADYEAAVADLKTRGEKVPDTLKKPGELSGPKWSRRPSGLYNGMIAPLQPFAIRGMIWYQGEWDCHYHWTVTYHDLFIAAAKSWRDDWRKAARDRTAGDFPIYIVQLPARDPNDNNARFWSHMRENQLRLSKEVPDSGLVTTFDTNDPTNMHPVEKTPIGQRLASLALGREYGKKLSWHGPEFQKARLESKGMLIEFDPGDDAIRSKDGEPLRWFELAGSDGVYHPATGEIRGRNQVLVSSPEVSKPVTVRYAFVPAAVNPNFYNSSGLPAGPFRTDEQPPTEKK